MTSATDLRTDRTRTYAWQDPAPTVAALGGRAGIDVLRAMLAGELPPPPVMATLGMEVELFEEGRAVFALVPDELHENPLGSVHGGVIATLLDSAAGCAVHSQLPAAVGFSSIEIKVSFLSPANGATLEIEGRSLRVGRQVAFAEAHARTAGGKLIGHATTSLALVRG